MRAFLQPPLDDRISHHGQTQVKHVTLNKY
jgi:hypothetical protein